MCKDTPDSVGEVYACLARFKFDKRLSAKCRKEVQFGCIFVIFLSSDSCFYRFDYKTLI